jgi:hypothetical protein
VQMLDRQRVQQAAADAAKKLVDAAALAARELADAFSDFCLCVCMQQGRHIAHKFESG